MSHGPRRTAAQDIANIRKVNDARASVPILLGRSFLAKKAAEQTPIKKLVPVLLAEVEEYRNAMLEARKDAESWEQRS